MKGMQMEAFVGMTTRTCAFYFLSVLKQSVQRDKVLGNRNREVHGIFSYC